MEEAKKIKKKNNLWWIILFIILALGLMVFLVSRLFHSETTYTSNNDGITSIGSLYCKSTDPKNENTFFGTGNAETVLEEIKVAFNDDGVGDISYTMNAKYKTPEMAKNAESTLHGDYNLYLQDHNVEVSTFTPNFTNIEDRVKIGIYASSKKIDKVATKLFALDAEDNLSKISIKTLKQIYTTKGFTCEVNN